MAKQKIPITIGIIGHLDAVLTPAHTTAVKNILQKIAVLYPNSPVALFSQLALGADTQIAQLFLEEKEKHQRNYQLINCLPYNVAYYKKTQFSNPEQLATFTYLQQQSHRCFTINQLTPSTQQILDKDPTAYPKELNTLYRKGGEFVADSALILIALWDEIDNNLEGGTANTVTYKKTGTYQQHISEHIFDAEGSLISIPCNRKGNNKPIHLQENYIDTLLKDSSIKKALDKIEDLNTTHTKTASTKVTTSANYLFPEQENLSTNNTYLKNIFAIADTQADIHQTYYNKIIKTLFFVGFVLFAIFEIYKQLGLHQALFFSTLTLIVLGFGLFKFSFKWKNHQKYIENRVLAEALRVQFFWNLSKQKESVSKYIMRIHKKEYNWLKHLLLSIYGVTYLDKNTVPHPMKTIKKHWIDDQKKYFNKKIKELRKKEKQYKIGAYILFGLGLMMLIAIFIVNTKYNTTSLTELLIVIASILFGFLALLKGYYEKRGYEQTQTQYSLMVTIYEASSKKIEEIDALNHKNESSEINNILLLTGKEALAENGNWYMIYKEKDPTIEGVG